MYVCVYILCMCVYTYPGMYKFSTIFDFKRSDVPPMSIHRALKLLDNRSCGTLNNCNDLNAVTV